MTVRVIPALALLFLLCSSAWAGAMPAVSFYYGAEPPWDELDAFDWVVLEPEHATTEGLERLAGRQVFAYVSVGEADPGRAWLNRLPAGSILGSNPAWGSLVIDQSQAHWPAYFVDNVITPLWQQGFRGFFLDTLDSYQLYATDADARAQQEAGLINVIQAVKARYPEAQLFFNRGFEILPRVHELAAAVAAESLYAGRDPDSGGYRPVPEADRAWLTGRLDQVRKEYRLPVVVIDYLPPERRAEARKVAEKIRAHGYIPWVADHDHSLLGIGAVEVMPRKVLMLYGDAKNETELMEKESVVLYGSMPLNYFGYTAEYLDAHGPLPEHTLTGRYAGAVIWLQNSLPAAKGRRLAEWMARQTAAGLPVLVLGNMEFLRHPGTLQQLGLQRDDLARPVRKLALVQHAASIGFETRPLPDRSSFFPLAISAGTPLAVVEDDEGRRQVAAAITPWGGYALNPYAVVTQPGEAGDRWAIDPFFLMQKALRLPPMPVPDVSTESGRRMLLIHMDGDGFASRAELPGNPYAAEVLRDEILKKHRLPVAISIIEGETGPTGLYPELSPQLESVARDILALPHVEIASHSYSHPFDWGKVAEDGTGEGYNLPLPGYQFNMNREIEGSIAYIESRLAPPGKKVRLFHWTGNCNPTIEALAETVRAGVGSINGGDTVMTRSLPTYTAVAPLGVQKGGYFQVYAPNQNENVYTNDWEGPFYGYRRVIETFEMTDAPRRLKPINIYYHTYAASKPSSLAALDEVHRWAVAQQPAPVYTSEYVRKVHDFNHVTVARTAQGWRIRGLRDLRQLRLPAALGVPDLARSSGLAGYNEHLDQRYLHTGAAEAELVLDKAARKTLRLVSANAPLRAMERSDHGLRLEFAPHVALQVEVEHAARCTFSAAGKPLTARKSGSRPHLRYALDHHAAAPIEALCTQ